MTRKELEEIRSLTKKYTTQIMDLEAQLKAKDEEIKELSKKCAEIAYDFENAVEEIEKLKTKDDEIKELKLELLKSFPKIANTKARKIVAMLFWTMKRQKAIYITSFNELGINNHITSFYKGAYENSNLRFKQAYKMLKENA